MGDRPRQSLYWSDVASSNLGWACWWDPKKAETAVRVCENIFTPHRFYPSDSQSAPTNSGISQCKGVLPIGVWRMLAGNRVVAGAWLSSLPQIRPGWTALPTRFSHCSNIGRLYHFRCIGINDDMMRMKLNYYCVRPVETRWQLILQSL